MFASSIVMLFSAGWLASYAPSYSEKVSLNTDFAIRPHGLAGLEPTNSDTPLKAYWRPRSLFVMMGSQSVISLTVRF